MTGYLRVWSFQLNNHCFTAEFDSTDDMVRVTGHDLGQKYTMAATASPEDTAMNIARELIADGERKRRA